MFLRPKKSHKDQDDLSLIRLYRENGDREIIGILFERYTHLVFGICMKYLKDVDDSKDAVMVIFEKLMDDLMAHDVTNFSSWLHSVARNHCLMQLRSTESKLRKEKDYQQHEHQFMEKEETMHLLEGDQKEKQLQLLELAINELHPDQQKCIKLFYFDQKSYSEIVELTGYDAKKVKSYLQNAKRNLKILMEKQSGKNSA